MHLALAIVTPLSSLNDPRGAQLSLVGDLDRHAVKKRAGEGLAVVEEREEGTVAP